MRKIAMLIRILAVIGLLFLPKAFSNSKALGHGSAISEYLDTHYVDFDSMTDGEFSALSDQFIVEGIKCATFMVLGLNLPFLACLFLSTYIATPRKVDEGQKLFIRLYLGFVVLGLTFLPFGMQYSNSLNSQDLSFLFLISCIYWLLLGGIPIIIALLSRCILIKKMRKSANQKLEPTC